MQGNVQFVEVNYPTGFTKSNCVAISSMAKVTGIEPPNDIYSEYDGRVCVNLWNDKVDISFSEAWGVDMDYKVVLMKIS